MREEKTSSTNEEVLVEIEMERKGEGTDISGSDEVALEEADCIGVERVDGGGVVEVGDTS